MKQFKILLLTTLLYFANVPINAQNNAAQFISEISENDARLNQGQSQKLAKLKSNKSFDEVRIVQLGNLQTLEKRGALPIKIPGVNARLVARRTSLKAFSEKEFQWSGQFNDGLGDVFINANKDGILGGLFTRIRSII